MISNSSPLIVFGKINKLGMLIKVYKKIEIVPSVYSEVVEQGKKINAPEAFLVQQFVEDDFIVVKDLVPQWQKKAVFFEKIYKQLDLAEAQTIALALQEKQKTLLVDERIAREIALFYGLKPQGSLKVLLLAFKSKIITEKELRQLVFEMTSTKFRLSAEVINKFWILFEKIKNERR